MVNDRSKIDRTNWPLPYQNLSNAMARIRARIPNLCVLGCSGLNPRQAIPPEHLLLMQEVEAAKQGKLPPIPSNLQIIKKWIVCVLVSIYDTLVIAILKLRFGHNLRAIKPEDAKIIMKIWSSGPAAHGKETDFYYGDLRQRFGRLGVGAMHLSGDGRSEGDSFSKKILRLFVEWKMNHSMLTVRPVRYLPEWILPPVGSSILTAFHQLSVSLKLRKIGSNTGSAEISVLARRATLDVLRPFTTRNVMHYYISRAINKRWKPKAFITLCEGQIWEKLSYLGTKRTNPSCKTVGYQHTILLSHSPLVISKENHAWEPQGPDLIICTGQTTKNMMEPSYKGLNTRFLPFGSPRRSLEPVKKSPQPSLKSILVVPEGMHYEAVNLFNFAIDTAEALKDHKFIFRCHPILPIEVIKKDLKKEPFEISNIEISREPKIEKDFMRCSGIFYRGSSAVLFSVLYGIKPIFVADFRGSSADPFFRLKTWREVVSKPSDAVEVLQQYSSKQISELQKEWEPAFQFANDYNQPILDETLKKFIQTAEVL